MIPSQTASCGLPARVLPWRHAAVSGKKTADFAGADTEAVAVEEKLAGALGAAVVDPVVGSIVAADPSAVVALAGGRVWMSRLCPRTS